jgi:Zn-finger nucleic acid-binding protein
MDPRVCPRCRAPLRAVDYQGIEVAFCGVCRGGLTSVDTLAELLGHPLDGAEQGEASLGDMDECAACGSPVIRNRRPESTWMSCASCDGVWIESGVIGRVQSRRPPTSKPPSQVGPSIRPATTSSSTAPSRTPSPRPDDIVRAPMEDDVADDAASQTRLRYDLPLVQYLALPIAGFIGLVLGAFGLARPIVFIAQIWFHEVGHAIPAWLSSRAALPLPFGFTFWREDSSWFTALCVLFLIGVLGVTSFREKRPYGVVAAVVLALFWAYQTLYLDPYASIGWVLFGGLLGELVLSTVAIVSFYYRAPDRLRWDFWRYIVLLPAACVFASSFAMWVRIDMGAQALPLGSIIGAPGDGTGDIERMIAGYGWTGETLTTTYRTIGTVCLLVIALHYAFFALRALRSERSAPSPRR